MIPSGMNMEAHRHRITILRYENTLHEFPVRKMTSSPMQWHKITIVNDENVPHESLVSGEIMTTHLLKYM